MVSCVQDAGGGGGRQGIKGSQAGDAPAGFMDPAPFHLFGWGHGDLLALARISIIDIEMPRQPCPIRRFLVEAFHPCGWRQLEALEIIRRDR